MPLRITATDYEEGRSVVFDSGPVIDAVLASTALPGIFPPYEIDGRYYIDGAISEQLPLKAALEAGADTIYVMAVSVPSPPPDRRSPLTILRHSLTILLYPRIRLDALDLPGAARQAEDRPGSVTGHAGVAVGHVPPPQAHRQRLRDDQGVPGARARPGTGSSRWPPCPRWRSRPRPPRSPAPSLASGTLGAA